MANQGHYVIGIDVDESRVISLNSGKPPFYEPQFEDVLHEALASGRLQFSTDISRTEAAQVHFITVGTPQLPGSNATDMTYVDSAVSGLIPYVSEGDLVIGKSTVPVGTAIKISQAFEEAQTGAIVAWNPEFLREGFAVKDTLYPDRIVYGLPSNKSREDALSLLNKVYAPIINDDTPIVVTDYQTAELVKVSANAFLATKISFINAVSEIAHTAGADITQLADALGYDSRIGRSFLNAGAGFGGGCLPKDLRAFIARSEEIGSYGPAELLREVDSINLRQRDRVVNLAVEALSHDPKGKKIAILGLAFKPNSDDIRDSPALDIALKLKSLGANVVATDPQAIPTATMRHPDLKTERATYDALSSADLVIVATEWADFVTIDPFQAHGLVKYPVVIDARNCLDEEAWSHAGWTVIGLGRPVRKPV